MTTTGIDPHPRVLVLRGSPERTVAAVADALAEELRAHGVRTDVARPSEVVGLAGYDGIVVGSTAARRHWHPAAVRFLRRHSAVLRVRPLWLFQIDRHAHQAAAGALTGVGSDRVPRILSVLLDEPRPVVFRTAGDTSVARRWARTVAAALERTPSPVPAAGHQTDHGLPSEPRSAGAARSTSSSAPASSGGPTISVTARCSASRASARSTQIDSNTGAGGE